MKKELGFGKCGLACCLCGEHTHCAGCEANGCPGALWCVNRKCSIEKGYKSCRDCEFQDCQSGILKKVKARAFNKFIKEYGEDKLMECLLRNEKNGIVYHRKGVEGDYDTFDDVDELIAFIKTGQK